MPFLPLLDGEHERPGEGGRKALCFRRMEEEEEEEREEEGVLRAVLSGSHRGEAWSSRSKRATAWRVFLSLLAFSSPSLPSFPPSRLGGRRHSTSVET
jgi:hypothetical protein